MIRVYWDLVRENGDATQDHILTFGENPTLREFLEWVKERKEWGTIYKGKGWENHLLEYDREGRFSKLDEWEDSFLDRKIARAFTNGGWGSMNYHLEFEPIKVKYRRIKGEQIHKGT